MKRLFAMVMLFISLIISSCGKPLGTSDDLIPQLATEILIINNGMETVSNINQFMSSRNQMEMMQFLDSSRTAYVFDLAERDIMQNLIFVLPIDPEGKKELESRIDDRNGDLYYRDMDLFIEYLEISDGEYIIGSFSPEGITNYMLMDKLSDEVISDDVEILKGFLKEYGDADFAGYISPASVDALYEIYERSIERAGRNMREEPEIRDDLNKMLNGIEYAVVIAPDISENPELEAIVYFDDSAELGSYFIEERSIYVDYAPVDPSIYLELDVDLKTILQAIPQNKLRGGILSPEMVEQIQNGLSGSISALIYTEGRINTRNPLQTDFKAAIMIGISSTNFIAPIFQQTLGQVPPITNFGDDELYVIDTGMGQAIRRIYVYEGEEEIIIANNEELITTILNNAEETLIAFGNEIELEAGMNRALEIQINDQDLIRMLLKESDIDVKANFTSLELKLDGATDYSSVKLKISAEQQLEEDNATNEQ